MSTYEEFDEGAPALDDVEMDDDDAELNALAGNPTACGGDTAMPPSPRSDTSATSDDDDDDGGGPGSTEQLAPPPQAPQAPLGAAEELRQMQAVADGAGPLAPTLAGGASYFLVANRWWRQWTRYSGFDEDADAEEEGHGPTSISGAAAAPGWVADFEEDADARPGPMDNTPIFAVVPASTTKLRKNILEVLGGRGDYVILRPEAHALLAAWYGGGPPAERPAVADGAYGRVKLDLYGMSFKVHRSAVDADPKQLEISIPKSASVADLKLLACKTFGIDPKSCQLWDWFNNKPYADLEPSLKAEDSLKSAKLIEDQDLYLNERTGGADGGYPKLKADYGYGGGSSGSSGYSYGGGGYSYNSSYSAGDSAVDSRPPPAPGSVGLQNLGNTCFMNSVLQCLSHTPGLPQFFAKAEAGGRFAADLNEDNPLGHNGKLAEAFGSLLQLIHSGGCSAVAPRNFKHVMGEARPEFAGYNQHDSQELLSFLLDGLHEDLNLVRVKPFVEATEGKGRPDAEVAAEALGGHRMRNRSWVQDLYLGQYRSTVVCPNAACDHHTSVTFDPYTSVTLPLVPPKDESKKAVSVVVARASGEAGLAGACQKLSVQVERDCKNRDLKKAAIEAANSSGAAEGAPPLLIENCVMFELFANKVFTWFEDGDDCSVKGSDIAVLMEVGDPRHFTDGQHSYGRSTRSGLYSSSSSSSYGNNNISSDDEDAEDADSDSVAIVMLHAKFVEPTYSYVGSRKQAKLIHAPWLFSLSQSATPAQLHREVLQRLRALVRPGPAHTKHQETGRGNSVTGLSNGRRVSQGSFDAIVNDIMAEECIDAGCSYDDCLCSDRNEAESKAVARLSAQGKDLSAVDAPPTTGAAAAAGGDGGGGGGGGGPPSGSDDGSDLDMDLGLATAACLSAEEVQLLDSVLRSPADCFVIKACSSYGPSGASDSFDPIPAEGEEGSQAPLLDVTAPKYGKPDRKLTAFVELTCAPDAAALLDKLMDATPYSTLTQEDNNSSYNSPSETRPALELDDCLDLFSSTETLTETETWYCPTCKDHVLASKTLDFWSAPPVLVFHLKRFTYDEYSRDKNETTVRYPLEIDMKDRILSKTRGTAEEVAAETVYALFAVSTHFGGMGGGHYTAAARSTEDGSWCVRRLPTPRPCPLLLIPLQLR